MRVMKYLWAGLVALAAWTVSRAQPVSLPSEPASPLVSTTESRPAPAERLFRQQAAQHALELGLPSLAAEIYRELLAWPGGDRAALTLSLTTALLDDGRVGEAEQALQGLAAPREAAWHLR